MHEGQYDRCIEHRDRHGATRLGLMTSYTWHHDPRHLLFTLARYKFVAKLLRGRGRVLEVGCADAFASRIVQQEVGALVAVDLDEAFVQDALGRMQDPWRFDCRVHDLVRAPLAEGFDGAYSVDVLEHIPPADEARFIGNLAASLGEGGVAVVGTPSLESQVHASVASREGHVNCKNAGALRECLGRAFRDVFVFSMNDEVVHTGFDPMAQYLMALCVGRR
ncbi:MAG: class I SAM-dependent methyltransferase [Planctomycetes bacterium]|nr:class I SAM-dependent methyltransferase [Planctomycetota bacterium]